MAFFIFFLNFNRTFCKQTVETLVRYRVLLGMIWVFTVYLCPTKRMVGLCGLISMYENISEKCRKAYVIFFLGYFFSENIRLFGIFWLISAHHHGRILGWGGGGVGGVGGG